MAVVAATLVSAGPGTSSASQRRNDPVGPPRFGEPHGIVAQDVDLQAGRSVAPPLVEGAVPSSGEVPPVEPTADQLPLAEQVAAGPEEVTVGAGTVASPGAEIESEETAYIDAVAGPNGVVVASVYQQPVNYRDVSGDWVDLDLSLQLDGQGGLVPEASGNPVRLGRFADDERLAEVSLSGDPNELEPGESISGPAVGFSLRGADRVKGIVSGAEVRYPEALPGVDVSLAVESTGVKEWVTLREVTTSRDLTFDLGLRGATARLVSSSGTVLLESPSGEPLGEIPPGWMVDAAGETSHGVSWALESVGGGQFALTADLDHGWLDDPERAWPVRVDPTVVRYDPNLGTSDNDTTVSVSGHPTAAEHELSIGYDPTTFGSTASYLKFDAVSQLRNYREIYFAALNLTSTAAANCRTTGYRVFRVTEDWRSDSMTRWPGADYTTAGSVADAFPGGSSGVNCVNGWAPGRRSIGITEIVRGWVRGETNNYGLTLRANDSSDRSHFKQFFSSNHPDRAMRPHVVVGYRSYGMQYSPRVVTPLTLTENGRIRLGLQNLGDPVFPGTMGLVWRLRRADGGIIRDGSVPSLPAMGTNGTASIEFDVGKYSSSIRYIEFDIAHLGWAYFSQVDSRHPVRVPFEIISIPQLTRAGPGGYVTSLEPTLKAAGKDELHPRDPLTYAWELCPARDGGGSCKQRSGTGPTTATTSFAGYSNGLTPARRYSFRVRVRNSRTGEESPWSPWVNFRTYVLQPTEFSWGKDRYTELQHMVNPKTGALVYSAVDSKVSVTGPALAMARTYNSPNTANAGLGAGWTHPWSSSIIREGDMSVLLVHADGQRERWAKLDDGTFVAPPASPGTTLTEGPSGYTLRLSDGGIRSFDSAGRVTAITDRHGRRQTIAYSSGRLDRVTDVESGRYLYFAVNNVGHIVSARTNPVDGVDEVWTYSYTGSRLTGACAPGSEICWRYSYDSSGRLDRVIEPRGNDAVAVRYGAPDGAVHSIEHHGRQHSFNWWDRSHEGSTVAITSEGEGTRWMVHDAAGRLTKLQAPAVAPDVGLVTTYGYNDAGLVDSITTGGRTTSMAFDSHGRLLARTVPLSDTTSATTWFSYSSIHTDPLDPRFFLPVEVRDPRSDGPDDNRFLTQFAYDGHGRVVFESGPRYDRDGNLVVRAHRYTSGTEAAIGGGRVPPGLLLAMTVAGRPNTLYSYDAAGDLRRVTTALQDDSGLTPDPTAEITEYSYDAIGNPVQHRVVNANTGPGGATTLIHYDELNRVVGRVSPEVSHRVAIGSSQRVDVYGYDGNSNLVLHRRTGQRGQDSVWSARYDSANRMYEETLPSGGVQSYTYTAHDEVDVFSDARGMQVDHDYDETTGWLSRRTLLNYRDQPGSDPFDLVAATYGYDARGRLVEQVDPLGTMTRRSYTADGRLQRESIRYMGSSGWVNRDLLRYQYDDNGNVVSVVSANGSRRLEIDYDPLNRPIRQAEVSASGEEVVTRTEYDPHGRPTRIEGPGDALTTIGYDDLTRTTYRIQHLAHDVGEETDTSPTLSALTTTVHDNSGLPVRITDPRGGLTTIGYDALGRPDRIEEPLVASDVGGSPVLAQATTEFSFDFAGNVTAQRDAEGRVTQFAFDTSDRLVRVDHPGYQPPGGQALSAFETWSYDQLGALTAHRERNGATTEYSVDDWGRTYERREASPGPGHPRPVTQYSHNRNGQQVRLVTATGAVHDTWYDEMRRPHHSRTYVRSSARWLSTVTTYNDADQPVVIASPEGRATRVDYDDLGRPTSIRNGAGDRTAFGYHSGTSLLESVTDPLNRSTRFTHDRAGRVTETVFHDALGSRVSATQSSYNAAGDKVSDTSARGYTTSYAYDAAGRHVGTTEDVDGNPLNAITTTTAYNRAGETTRTRDGRGLETQRTYNSWGLLETETEPPAFEGQPLSERRWTHSYGLDGQLLRTVAPGSVVTSNTYDDLGRLVSASGSGAEAPTPTSTFAYDSDHRLTSFSHPSGTQRLNYDDAGRITSSAGPAGNTTWAYDGDGNVLTLNQPGSIVTTAFDSAGRPVRQSDNLTNASQVHSYDRASQRTSTSFGGGRTRVFTYDSLGRPDTDVLTAAGAVVRSVDYEFDDDHNLIGQVRAGTGPDAGPYAYSYDHAGRLTSEMGPGQSRRDITWDKSSNRTRHGSVTYSYDNRNQLVASSDGSSYAWRPRGVLASETRSGTTVAHAYSARNQPVSIGATTYVHDALGREALRNSTQVFRYAGLSATPSMFGNQSYATAEGMVVASKVPGSAIASVHINDQVRGDYSASLHPTAATLIAHRGYSPFGVSTAESGAALSRIGFQGDWSDPTTRLVHADRRVYDPAISVFTTRDELARGAAGSPGHNRYLYGAASPLVHTDRSGNNAIPFPVPDVFDAVKGGFDALKGGLAGVGAGVGAGVAWVGGKAAAAAGLLGVGAAVVGVFAIGFGIGYASAAVFSWAWSGGTQADGLPGCVRCGPLEKPPPVEKQLPLTEFVPSKFPAGTPLTGVGAAETLMDSAAQSSGSNVAAVVSVVGAAASGLLAVDGFSEAADEQYAASAGGVSAGGQSGGGCGSGGLDLGDAVELALDLYDQLRPDDAMPGVPWLSPGGGRCGGGGSDRTDPPQRDATNSAPDIAGANFAQTTARESFSAAPGRFAGQTIDDVAGGLRSGAMSPADVPVEVIVRDGNTLILNTRSAQALEQAGIPRSQWSVVNMTGDAAAEARLTGQLTRNGLDSSGTPTVRRTGR